MKAKTYILMKDLPDSKVGDEYIWVDYHEAYYLNGDTNKSYWIDKCVENNPTWFKLKEEKKVAVPQEAAYREMIFHRNTKNPYSSEGQSYTAYKKGFEECWEHFFNAKEPEPTPQNIKEEKPVLFITEDGQPAYIGCRYWLLCVISENWPINETIMRQELATPPSYFKYFSTKEAAETYVLNNKPCLSIKDIKDYLYDCSVVSTSALIEKMTDIVKQKIN